jgi:hypothetical protein
VINNIITHCGTAGISGDTQLGTVDYNLYFSNGTHCNGCPAGLGMNSKTEDPLYINAAGDNYDLQVGSAAINNADPSLGVDRNDGGAGDFNGAGPDIGFYETAF